MSRFISLTSQPGRTTTVQFTINDVYGRDEHLSDALAKTEAVRAQTDL